MIDLAMEMTEMSMGSNDLFLYIDITSSAFSELPATVLKSMLININHSHGRPSSSRARDKAEKQIFV